MKVAHILYSGLGGHGSVFFSLVGAPSESTIEHHPVFYGIEPLRPEYQRLCEDYDLKYSVIHKQPGSHYKPQLEVLRALQSLNAEAVVIHSSPCMLASSIYRLLKFQVPLVFVEHQPNHQKNRQEWAASFVAPWLCHKVVYLTEASREEVQQKIGLFYRPSRAAVISNGIDTSKFHQSTRPKDQDSFRVGMAARMNDLKDQESLIRAFAIAVNKSKGLQLLLAGDGPSRSRLEALATELGLVHQVVFLGTLDNEELVRFYQDLDLYAHSTLGETMSTSIMQAQACGLPIVASDVAGVNNQILHSQNGVLVSPKDPSSLAQAILQLQGDERSREELSRASRKAAELSYSHRAMRREYELLIEAQVWRASH